MLSCARIDGVDFFDSARTQRIEDEFRVRIDQNRTVVLQPEAEDLRVCAGELEQLPNVARLSQSDVEDALVRELARASISRVAPSWESSRARLEEILKIAVVAVAIGGVRCRYTDKDGFAAPLLLGDGVVVGHLDESMQLALAQLARRSTLPGFRFTDDSWWAEDICAALDDPDIAEELLEAYGPVCPPWLVIGMGIHAVGVVAELDALAQARAFLGMLLVVAAPLGSEIVPWVVGETSTAEKPTSSSLIASHRSSAPQRVDRTNLSLDRAECALQYSKPNVPIDIAEHVHGPAGPLLQIAADPETWPEGGAKLGTIGRLYFAARQQEDHDAIAALTLRALDLLEALRQDLSLARDLDALAAVGATFSSNLVRSADDGGSPHHLRRMAPKVHALLSAIKSDELETSRVHSSELLEAVRFSVLGVVALLPPRTPSNSDDRDVI